MLGLGNKPPLSQEEKLDAVYAMLRRAERARRLAWAVRLALVGAAVFAVFSFVSNPNAAGMAESLFERYMLPRLTDMAGRMAEKMQADMLGQIPEEYSPADAGTDNVDEGDDSAMSPEARALLRRFSNIHRARAAEVADRLPPGTLESYGFSREEFLAAFPE